MFRNELRVGRLSVLIIRKLRRRSNPSILGGTYEPEGVKVKVRGDPYVFKVGGGPPNGPNNFTIGAVTRILWSINDQDMVLYMVRIGTQLFST